MRNHYAQATISADADAQSDSKPFGVAGCEVAMPEKAQVFYAHMASLEAGTHSAQERPADGKKIGVSENSVQEGQLKEWIAANAVQAEVVELMSGESENEAVSCESIGRPRVCATSAKIPPPDKNFISVEKNA